MDDLSGLPGMSATAWWLQPHGEYVGLLFSPGSCRRAILNGALCDDAKSFGYQPSSSAAVSCVSSASSGLLGRLSVGKMARR